MKRKWSQRSLKNLNGIHPDLRRVMDRALQESPLDFVVIEGLRTKERQKQLVAEGASWTLNSRHLTGHAVDIVPIGPNGKAAFDWPLYHRLAPAVKAAAAAEGVALDWGGDWRKQKDGPHFELNRDVYPETDWKTGDKPPMERTSLSQSTEIRAAVTQIGGGGAGVLAAMGALDGETQKLFMLGFFLVAAFGVWFYWKRLVRWRDGDR
jgi:peptidoglycan L-alanyl-D-glutamate endopeptidase CwlK